MNIEQTDSCLVVTVNKKLARYIGLIITLAALGTMIWWSATIKIICMQKSPGIASQCTLQTSLFHVYSSSKAIGDLQRAWVKDEGRDVNTGELQYAVILQSDKAEINLTEGSSVGRQDKTPVVDAINQYIERSQDNVFVIPYNTPLWSYLFLIVIALWGVRMMCFRDLSVQFNKETKMVNFCYGRLKNISQQIPWSEVQRAFIQESRLSRRPAYRLALFLMNQKIIPFTFSYHHNQQQQQAIADQINHYLKNEGDSR